ncbi:MAG TPA: pyruvate ferredoxin oxidoreductase [Tepidimicrobium sp.]|nr:pyruvate ferredoxin oxidoreductase [Tepidimicrobium sp.]
MTEKEFRILSRGGQGAVTAAHILVEAAVLSDKYAQAVPNFGQERKGAPVYTFARLSDKPIESHTYVYNPDIVVMFDSFLMELGIDPLEGIGEDSILIINDRELPHGIRDSFKKVGLVDAWSITHEVIGNVPPNAAMLGAIAKTTGLLDIESIMEAIVNVMGEKIGQVNAKCAKTAYERTVVYEG